MEFLSRRARGVLARRGSSVLRTRRGRTAPTICKNGSRSSRIELANASQLTVNRGLVFTMSLESLLDLRRPAVHCTRRPPRREQMACRFRLLDRKGERRFAHPGVICSSRARGGKNSFLSRSSGSTPPRPDPLGEVPQAGGHGTLSRAGPWEPKTPDFSTV